MIQYDCEGNFYLLRTVHSSFRIYFSKIQSAVYLSCRNSKPSGAIVLARLGRRVAGRHGVVVRRRALTPVTVLELTVVLRGGGRRLLLCTDAVLLLPVGRGR